MKAWILAKPGGDIMEWYEYNMYYVHQEKPEYTLSKTLRISNEVQHATKESAKGAALKLGLKSWRYVTLN